jgi:hypothetical protein
MPMGGLMRRALVAALVICVPAVAASSISGASRARPRRADAPNLAVKRQLVGSWRLADFVARDAEGKISAHLAGERPLGRLTYTSDGNVWAHIGRRDCRPSPADTWYTGTFHVDAAARTVTHRVLYSVARGAEGTNQVRHYRLRSNRLLLWIPSGNGRLEIAWIREKRWARDPAGVPAQREPGRAGAVRSRVPPR